MMKKFTTLLAAGIILLGLNANAETGGFSSLKSSLNGNHCDSSIDQLLKDEFTKNWCLSNLSEQAVRSNIDSFARYYSQSQAKMQIILNHLKTHWQGLISQDDEGLIGGKLSVLGFRWLNAALLLELNQKISDYSAEIQGYQVATSSAQAEILEVIGQFKNANPHLNPIPETLTAEDAIQIVRIYQTVNAIADKWASLDQRVNPTLQIFTSVKQQFDSPGWEFKSLVAFITFDEATCKPLGLNRLPFLLASVRDAGLIHDSKIFEGSAQDLIRYLAGEKSSGKPVILTCSPPKALHLPTQLFGDFAVDDAKETQSHIVFHVTFRNQEIIRKFQDLTPTNPYDDDFTTLSHAPKLSLKIFRDYQLRSTF